MSSSLSELERSLFNAIHHYDLMQIFILIEEERVNINVRSEEGGRNQLTPLMEAAVQGKEGVVRLLLELGANVNLRHSCRISFTATQLADQHGFNPIAQMIDNWHPNQTFLLTELRRRRRVEREQVVEIHRLERELIESRQREQQQRGEIAQQQQSLEEVRREQEQRDREEIAQEQQSIEEMRRERQHLQGRCTHQEEQIRLLEQEKNVGMLNNDGLGFAAFVLGTMCYIASHSNENYAILSMLMLPLGLYIIGNRAVHHAKDAAKEIKSFGERVVNNAVEISKGPNFFKDAIKVDIKVEIASRLETLLAEGAISAEVAPQLRTLAERDSTRVEIASRLETLLAEGAISAEVAPQLRTLMERGAVDIAGIRSSFCIIL